MLRPTDRPNTPCRSAQRRTTVAAGFAVALAALLGTLAPSAQAADAVLNIYSSRHYQTDDALYEGFTQATGIRINRLDGKEAELIERLRTEGTTSPADVLITTDASRLEAADELGLFQSLNSAALNARIPAALRTPNWVAFSTRARVIVYNPKHVKAEQVQNYLDLAKPGLKGQVCVRSGSHPYNLSLGAAMLAHEGAAATEAWAKGLVTNFARSPNGGDTDQILAVAAGECGVAISNSYYYARLLRSTKPKDQQAMAQVKLVWPNQQSWGTHINISGAGVLKHAPHPAAALQFLSYLASDAAQRHFADGNNEWPAVQGLNMANPALTQMGTFKPDTLAIGELAKTRAQAQKIFDRAGWR